jgi:putative PIN family toxin of toxin-antitoxin system
MTRLTAVLDANLLMSMILAQADPELSTYRLFEAASNQRFDLILPEGVLSEFGHAVRSKPYFTRRLTEHQIVTFELLLRSIGTVFSDAEVEIERVVRDPKDDYLVASTILAGARFLVTGDKDLLVLKEMLKSPEIVTAAEFLALIDMDNGQGTTP